MIKIGLLSYCSSIYPYASRDIADGFYAALPETIVRENFFHFVPDYVKQATAKGVKEAVQKLLFFDAVDVISGPVSYRSVPELIPLIQKHEKLGFFFDLGEYIPYFNLVSDHVYFNSMLYWQSQYALGNWAYKEFGDKGAVVMSLYDSGYHLHSAFRQGAIGAGSKVIDYCVLHGDPNKSMVKGKIDEFFKNMERAFPSYIHAIFCGSEATEFFEAFAASKLNGKVPLLITAHMASEEILSSVTNLGLRAYAASLYNYHSQDSLNIQFKSSFENNFGRKAGIFSLLGFEMGLLFKNLYPALRKKDFASARQLLKNERIQSPRGEISFDLNQSFALPVIDIEQIDISNKRICKMVVEQGKALEYNNQVYEHIHRENVSGWQNPYLAV
ncbi:ABC transporter substrate-binding protein [Cytophagaceae bacterium ABcell3]|nr:ABC transporter substrate-binding protein [Cytophagaceae bacterium ABcell3]